MVKATIVTTKREANRWTGTARVDHPGTNARAEKYVGKVLPFATQSNRNGAFRKGTEVYATLYQGRLKYVYLKTKHARR
jgi:hypothetical protein